MIRLQERSFVLTSHNRFMHKDDVLASQGNCSSQTTLTYHTIYTMSYHIILCHHILCAHDFHLLTGLQLAVSSSVMKQDASALARVVLTHEDSEAEREEAIRKHVDFSDTLQTPPRGIMKEIFLLQGISLDPGSIKYLVDQIRVVCTQGYGDGISKFDCFLNYRVAADKDIVEKVYWLLKAHGLHPFLDSECLKNGKDWKQGFLTGLKRCRVFIAFISHRALEGPRSFDRDHRKDNVLLEYEMALRVKKALGKSNYILPLLVGEYAVFNGQSVLVKFQDFSPSLYSPSLTPLPVPSTVPTAAASNVPSPVSISMRTHPSPLSPSAPAGSSAAEAAAAADSTRPLVSLSCQEVHALLKNLKICDNLKHIEEEGFDGVLMSQIESVDEINELNLGTSKLKAKKLLVLLDGYRSNGVSLQLLVRTD